MKTVFTIVFNIHTYLYILFYRTQGLSFGSLSARLGATPAPFLTESLKLINPSLPFILIGSLSILSGLTSLLLPETVGKPTLESFADDIKGTVVFTLNRLRPTVMVFGLKSYKPL